MVKMSVFNLTAEPAHDHEAFAHRIHAALGHAWPQRVFLAPGGHTAPDGWKRESDSRLVLMLDGAQGYEWLDGRRPREQRLMPGDALWLAPGAPMREDWNEPCWFLGIVLRPLFLRFLLGHGAGDGQYPGQTPWAHHASLPLGEPGSLIAQALNRLAEGTEDPRCASELLRVFLRMAVTHSARCAEEIPGKAASTWRRVQEHVAANCHQDIDRSSTAEALGLNPTYLSEICTQHSGFGFARLVESVRLERARILLRNEPGLTIREVAERIGFSSAGYFSRIFHRATGHTPVAWRSR